MYAAVAAMSVPFGDVTTLSARLPSIVAATVTIFLFFGTFRGVMERRLALVAAMLMPVSLLWLDKAPSAEIDMLQLMWVSAALLCFLKALKSQESSELHPLRWWLAALLCVAAGFLTKWTAPAFFYLTVISVLCWRGRLALLWSWRHLLAVGLSATVCGLWAWAVAMQTGWEVLIDTVLAEAAQRLHPHHHGKPYPWLESLGYPFAVLGANLPWSLPALWALRPGFTQRWNENGQRLLQLLHCWTWSNLLFWSLPAQHHIRYSLPMCPGIVGLGVMVLIDWMRNWRQLRIATSVGLRNRFVATIGRLSPQVVILGILLAWCCTKIIFIEMIIPGRAGQSFVRETASRLNALVPPGEMLYLCKLKDEGVLFYYARPARRLHWETLPAESAFYALLIEAEWRAGKDSGSFDTVEWLHDQQGDAIVLVRFH